MALPTTRFWTGRRVFLTGHTGFKGSWLLLWLRMLGAVVAGFALPAAARSPFRAFGFQEEPHLLSGDLRDIGHLEQVVQKFEPEIVFHLAAQALVAEGYRDPLNTFAVNVLGTTHLLEVLRRVPSVRAVVVVTSDKCYENREWGWAYREESPLGGKDPYSASKAACELVTRAYRESFFGPAGVQVATVRAGNVIGGGDWSPNRLIPDIVRALETDKPLLVRNPKATRPWQFVLDALAGYLLLAERLSGPDGSEFASAWNFAPDESEARTVREVIERSGHGWGQMPKLTFLPEASYPEATDLKLDASLAQRKLGWRPRLDFDRALAWTAEGYRSLLQNGSLRETGLQQISRYQELS
jgi:CDP-glucose 4,6-dehydratase